MSKEQILVAAASCFSERGYRGASIASIAERAGLSDAGLLHHFGSKAELYEAVISLRERSYSMAANIGPEDSFPTLLEAIIEGMRVSLESPDLLRFRAVLGGESLLSGHPAREHLEDVFHQSVESIADRIHRDRESGLAKPGEDPRQIALELLALNDGLRAQWALDSTMLDLTAVFARAARALLPRAGY
ncbi:TetR/AcrR family transcriptional regulator [Arthrobacter sp. NPDC090010]|uniref:TetR/AcrR family transcriptional regulator n=1 Tax=Arthrobacter sp. NPDC090010 TaxID=3363942 RepID=UPI003827A4AE